MSLLSFGLIIIVGVLLGTIDAVVEDRLLKAKGTESGLAESYIFVLFLSSIACIGFGAYWWLKYGEWLTVNLSYLLSFLDSDNSIKNILLSDTKWVGLNKVSHLYLKQNVAWSFFIASVILLWINIWDRNDRARAF